MFLAGIRLLHTEASLHDSSTPRDCTDCAPSHFASGRVLASSLETTRVRTNQQRKDVSISNIRHDAQHERAHMHPLCCTASQLSILPHASHGSPAYPFMIRALFFGLAVFIRETINKKKGKKGIAGLPSSKNGTNSVDLLLDIDNRSFLSSNDKGKRMNKAAFNPTQPVCV